MSGRVLRLSGIRLNVRDLDGAARFYLSAFGADAAPVAAGCVRLRIGAQHVELQAADAGAAAYPAGSTASDLWFQHAAIVTGDMASAMHSLARFAAPPISRGGPQMLPAADGGVTAFKFRDPEGHPLELLSFPPGTSEWGGTGAVLGIDHTAISVADADRSIAFYCDGLGLAVASRTLNRGPAQDRLDGLDAATVEVVALRPPAAATPHVELLAYRPPGRAASRIDPGDIAATRTMFRTEDVAAIAARLADRVVRHDEAARTALLRDPDGHLVELSEQ